MATSVKPETPPAPTTPIPSAEELAAKVSRLIIKNNGDAAEAIQAVLDDNKNLRDHKRHWEAENERLKQNQIPKDGLVLTADQKKIWEKLTELKIESPDALVTLHKEHTELKTKDAEATKQQLIESMASGMDDKGQPINWEPKLLGELMNLKGLDGELKDAIIPDPNDKTKTISIKIPHVKQRANPNAAAEPLTQYVERELKGFQDALRKAAPADGKGATGKRTGMPREIPPQPTATTPAPASGSQGAADNLGVAQRVLAGRYGDPFAKPGDKTT